MIYGKEVSERIKVVKAEYENTLNGYKSALALFNSGRNFNDQSSLNLLVSDCHKCHDSLYSAFEVSLKVLTGTPVENDASRHFLSLKRLAENLDKIASGLDSPKLPNVDYSLAKSIDLSRIVTTKDTRNDLTHNGVIREFKHYSILFENLERLIKMLDPDFSSIITPIFESQLRGDIFDKFYNTIEKFEASYCSYVLIMDSTWDIPDDQLDNFISLPWDVIIDMDGRGIGQDGHRDRSRIEKSIISTGYLPISFYARNFDRNTFSTIDTADKVPYLNFSDGGIVLDQNIDKSIDKLQLQLRLAQRKNKGVDEADRNLNEKRTKMNSLQLFFQKYLGDKFERCIVVSTAEVVNGNNSVKDIIDMLANKYQFDIRVVLVQDPDEEYIGMPTWYENGIAARLDCELKNFIGAIDQQRSFLPAANWHVNDNVEEYRFPMRDGSVGKLKRNYVIKNVEEYFEILHLDVGNESGENDVELFYRGHLASWSAIRRGCAADIVKDRREKLEHQIVSSFTSTPDTNHAYYIVHEPGYGGTTLGRQIAWNIHKRFPVVRLKHYDKNIVNRIKDLYAELRQTPFLILIDTSYDISEESIDAMNRLFTMQINKLPPIVGLFVKRKQYHEKIASNKLQLTTIKPDEQKIVEEKCLEYARRLYPSSQELEEHVSSLYHNIAPQDRLPMIINLYIMDLNFVSPEQYVKSFIDKETMPDDIKKALKFIALYSYYTGYELPGKFVYFVCNKRSAGATYQRLKNFLMPYESLLLYINDNSKTGRRSNEPDAIKCRHWLFARELLHCLLGTEHWKRELKILSLDFLDCALQSSMDSSITTLLSRLFARKDSYKKEDSNGMTRLIEDVIKSGLQSDGISLLDTVSERINQYIANHPELESNTNSEDRHIFGLLARLWAQCARYYRKVNYNQDLMDKYTEKSLETLNASDDEFNREFYDLFHMAGCCWQIKLEKCLEKLSIDSGEEKINQIHNLYKKATDYFEKSVGLGNADYGLPSLITTQELVVRYIFSHLGFDKDNYRPEVLETPMYEWVLDVVDEANRLIDSENDYALDGDGRDNFIRAANKFRHTYLFGDSSLVLQNLQNYLDRINSDPEGEHGYSVQRTYMQMIHYMLYKHQNDYIRLFDNKDDFDRINRYVKEALKYYGDKSHFLYRLWFKLAKLGDFTFTEAKQRAQDWKAVPVKAGQRVVLPYYYMYIISLLSGQPESDIKETWNELSRHLSLSREESKSELIYDYYRTKKDGMGCLVDRAWAQFNDVESNDLVSWISGRVVFVSENEASGWINTTEVKYLDRKQHTGEGQIFFKPASTKLTNRARMEEVEFKFGFTLKRIQTIDRTVFPKGERNNAATNALNAKNKKNVVDKLHKGKQQQRISRDTISNVSHQAVQTTPYQCVLFKPMQIFDRNFEGRELYLNGTIDGEKAGLAYSDLYKYGNSYIAKYGGIKRILEQLLELKEIRVKVIRTIENGRERLHSVSLYEAGQDLAGLIHIEQNLNGPSSNRPIEEVTDQISVDKDTNPTEELEKRRLPNFINKEVQFVAKQETPKGGLKGTFEVAGQIWDGTITTGVNKKEIKHLLNKSGSFRAKVIDQSPKGYILRKL